MSADPAAASVADAIALDSSPVGEVPANERQARAMLANLEPAERQQVRQGTAPEHVVRKMAAPPPARPPRPKPTTKGARCER